MIKYSESEECKMYIAPICLHQHTLQRDQPYSPAGIVEDEFLLGIDVTCFINTARIEDSPGHFLLASSTMMSTICQMTGAHPSAVFPPSQSDRLPG